MKLSFKATDKELNETIYSDGIGLADFFDRVGNGRVDVNEIHPFVCEDKNGDKVFAGDEVIRRKDDPICSHKGIVTYRPRFADYVIVKDGYDVDDGHGNFGMRSEDIELIKEADHE